MIKDNIKIIITGDFCPHKRIEKAFLKKEYNDVFNGFEKIPKDCDLAITNLECPLTLSNKPVEKTGPNLKAHPDCINGIKFCGFKIVTLANNHIMDYGMQGLNDTINACDKNNIHYVGAGENLNKASKPLYITIKETKIAIVNLCENEWSIADKNKAGANPLNPTSNFYQINEAKKNADIILVIIHGGHEHYHLPSPRMVETYRFFANLGVTAVIGHHAHCVSGYEIYNGVPIFYSLGNFIFYWESKKPDSWYQGYFIKLSISDNSVRNFSLFPYFQCKNEVRLRLMEGDEKTSFLMKIEEYSNIIREPALLERKWEEFCKSRLMYYLSTLFRFNRIQKRLVKNRIIEKILFKNKRNLLPILNMFRCDSHREVMIKALESEIFKRD